MACLRTFARIMVDGRPQLKEIVVPMINIDYAISYQDEAGNPTSLLVMSGMAEPILHVDIPLKKMQEILSKYSRDSSLDFDTHPGVEDYPTSDDCCFDEKKPSLSKYMKNRPASRKSF